MCRLAPGIPFLILATPGRAPILLLMLAFSTCWNSSRHTDGEAMVDEILSLGFETIEISHGLKVSLLPGIRKAFLDGRVKVSGVHNFCPSPVELMIDAPDAYEFTSH